MTKDILNEVFVPAVALFSTCSNRTRISDVAALKREQFILEELEEMFRANTLCGILDAEIDLLWFAIEALYLLENKLPSFDFEVLEHEEFDSAVAFFKSIEEERFIHYKFSFLQGYCAASLVITEPEEEDSAAKRLRRIIDASWYNLVIFCEAESIDLERAITEVFEANMSKFYLTESEAEADVKERGDDFRVEAAGDYFAVIRSSDNKTMKAKHFKAPNWDWIYE
jgi:hypothetical protein